MHFMALHKQNCGCSHHDQRSHWLTRSQVQAMLKGHGMQCCELLEDFHPLLYHSCKQDCVKEDRQKGLYVRWNIICESQHADVGNLQRL